MAPGSVPRSSCSDASSRARLCSQWFIVWARRSCGYVPTKYLDKFNAFEESGKLSIVVFILFLIPAMPKDTFTYLVPLTNMRMRDFLVLSNVGRIPGIVISTYAANGLVDGNITQSIIIFAVVAVIAIVAIVFRDKIMNLFHHDKGENDR